MVQDTITSENYGWTTALAVMGLGQSPCYPDSCLDDFTDVSSFIKHKWYLVRIPSGDLNNTSLLLLLMQ